MGVMAVLQPRDSLRDHLPRMKQRRRTNPNPNPNPNPAVSNRRKRSPEKKNNNDNRIRTNNRRLTAANNLANNLVMGKVKILKRGEELPALKDSIDQKTEEKAGGLIDLELELSLTDRLRKPEMVAEQIRVHELYAGSAFFSSPPPSSLPLPAFFTKKVVSAVEDEATTYLRGLFHLDL